MRHSCFFVVFQVGLEGSPDVLLDPNTLSDDGTSALTGVDFSKDGKKLAYGISKKGSDWCEMRLMQSSFCFCVCSRTCSCL